MNSHLRSVISITLFVGAYGKYEKSILRIFDDSHFYLKAGAYLEPGGQYLSYAGSIIIPFSYVLPRFVVNHTDYYPKDDNITSMYYHLLEHLREMVGINQESRTMRMILPIISILSILIDNVGHISILVSDQNRTITSSSKRFRCAQRVDTLFHTFVENWFFSVPSEFLSAYTGSITRTLTPSLLSAKNLKDILLTHLEIPGTLYQYEPSIVYELGKVILTEVQEITSGVLKAIIQLPKVTYI